LLRLADKAAVKTIEGQKDDLDLITAFNISAITNFGESLIVASLHRYISILIVNQGRV